jgi:methylated-DNA-protein-cysteine methyltransferase-like protein
MALAIVSFSSVLQCPWNCAFYNALEVKRYELIWSVVKRIPHGRVATYGQVAALAGLDGHARQVGYALHNLPAKSDVPWHRVVNAKGEISERTAGDSHELQRMLLEEEGIEFDLRGRMALEKVRWKGFAKRKLVRP